MSGQLHTPAALPSGKNHGTDSIGGLVSARAGLNDLEKRNDVAPTGVRTPDRPLAEIK